ncbi:MAG: polyprenol phosphomannose-dependent alpha 1,6 mannosyltransferase MptB [Actinomycetota bacterium]
MRVDSVVAAAEQGTEGAGRVDDPGHRRRALILLAVVGVVGSLCVVVGGTLAGAAAPGESGRLWSVPTVPVRPAVSLLPALGLFYGGLIVLVRAWLQLRRFQLTQGLSLLAFILIVGLWAVPLLVGPPLGSRDVYAYAAQGRLAEQGFDVYEEGPASLGDDDPVLAPVDPLYLDAPVVYGPVFVFLSAQIAGVTGDGVITAVLAHRLMAVIGLIVTAVAVFDLARGLGRDPIDALVLGFANPLVLLHLVSGAHNEAIMLAFCVSGVTLGRRGGGWRPLGFALCAMAAAIKLPAILAVAFLGWPWVIAGRTLWVRAARLATAAGEALLVIALAGQLTGWGWGWVDAITTAKPVDAYLSLTRLAGGGVALLTGIEAAAVLDVARLLGLLLAVGVTLLLLFRGASSWPVALAWSLLIWAMLHPTTQPWYLTWGIMFLAATSAGERNRSLVVGCAVAAFVVLPVGPQLGWLVLEDTGVTSLSVGLAILVMLTFSPRSQHRPRRRAGLDPGLISVIVPTRHEADNVGPLVAAIGGALDGRRVEVLFVDDSDDGTPAAIEALAATDGGPDVALLHREVGRRWGGLGGAVVDGFERVSGSTAVVMDADLQHPATAIADLVAAVEAGAEVAVASRRVSGAIDVGLTARRRVLSRMAGGLVGAVFPQRVGRMADPMSGFFAVRLGALDLAVLQPDGFKILLEVLATHEQLRVEELPYRFDARHGGVSKASATQAVRFLGHLVDLRIRTSRAWAGAAVPQRIFRSA